MPAFVDYFLKSVERSRFVIYINILILTFCVQI